MTKQIKSAWVGSATQELVTFLTISEPHEKNPLKEMMRDLCADFEHYPARSIKSLQRLSGNTVEQSLKQNTNGELTCDDTEKVNILNSFFTNVFTHKNTNYILILEKLSCELLYRICVFLNRW